MAVSAARAAAGLALAVTLAACAEPAVENQAARQTSAWREPARYAFTVESACGERGFLGRYRLTVAQGKITKADGLDDSAKGWIASGPPAPLPTLAGLVAELEAARKKSADVARIEVDPTDQHPTKITIDPDKGSIDDEVCYTISDYVA